MTGTDDRSIDRAAEVLRSGGLVAIPTETVYGLAACASLPQAVERIFTVKGRPLGHPLIVHIGKVEDLREWSGDVPGDAALLAEAFWPGPLTLVLPRDSAVPGVITGGLDTVALRMPSHPVALAILRKLGDGIAAPSANLFGRVSPTTAADVVADLGLGVDLVVDGGPCSIGVESTVVEVGPADRESGRSAEVTILRPGGIAAEELEGVLGRPVARSSTGPSRAPGMLASHYAPRTPIRLCPEEEAAETVSSLTSDGLRVGVLAPNRIDTGEADVSWDAGGDLDLFAASLYRWLREADATGLDVLIAVPPEPLGLGAAICDRLERAATR